MESSSPSRPPTGAWEIEIEVADVVPEALRALEGVSQSLEATDGRIRVRAAGRESIPLVAEPLIRHGARIYSISPRGPREDRSRRRMQEEAGV